MSNAAAVALAERLNAKNAGILVYSVLSVGAESVVIVYDTEGNELGPL